MCVVYTQTEETKMDGGGAVAAAKQVNERQPWMNTQEIRELEEKLLVSKGFTTDMMLNINSVEQQVRKYVEAPIIRWSDDCECR
jgi:23S rRNA maturation-related 3'-5' exoribonuclease YhaM